MAVKLSECQRGSQVLNSYDCLEGLAVDADSEWEIKTVYRLKSELDREFHVADNWESRKVRLMALLSRIRLEQVEINRYAHWCTSGRIPYTRNLIATDGEHYSLLMLCWERGRESCIHSHPVDGCFVLPLKGAIRETLYRKDEDNDEVIKVEERVFDRGVSFMNDTVGLHKIGNCSASEGAITLHLYTPPFTSCKVWRDEKPLLKADVDFDRSPSNAAYDASMVQSTIRLSAAEVGHMEFFSRYGTICVEAPEFFGKDLEFYI